MQFSAKMLPNNKLALLPSWIGAPLDLVLIVFSWHVRHRKTQVFTCTHLCLLLPLGITISSHGPKQVAPPLLQSGDSFNWLFLLIHNLKYKQNPRLTTLEYSQFASSCAIFEILQCLSENVYIPVAQLVTWRHFLWWRILLNLLRVTRNQV